MDNHASNTLIGGTSGNDSIVNSGSRVTINAGSGADSITNSGAYVSINGGNDDDQIHNSGGSYSTLVGGAGDDYVENDADSSKVLINGSDGDDSVENSGADATINGGEGNDSVRNSGSHVLINGDAGDDRLGNSNYAQNVTIDGGEGNDNIINVSPYPSTMLGGAGDDTIVNTGASMFADGGDGDDSIRIYEESSRLTLRGGAGEDKIWNKGTNVLIESGDDDDVIQNDAEASHATINAGDGSDQVGNFADYASIDGGKGDDFIWNMGSSNNALNGGADDDYINIDSLSSNVTALGGAGADSIYNYGARVSIDGGAGDDYIGNRNDKASIYGGDGADSITNNGVDAILNGGNGVDSLVNYSTGSNVLINGDAGDDVIFNYARNVTINGGAGNNEIFNVGESVEINTGSALDFIYSSANFVTIESGSGNDMIQVSGSNVYVDGGSNNDEVVIDSVGSYITVRGGAGADTVINGGSNVFIDGGNDDDDIQIRAGASNLTVNAGSGNDDIWNRGENISINAGMGADNILNYASGATIIGGTGSDNITNENASVRADGDVGNDFLNNRGTLASDVTMLGGSGTDSLFNESSRVLLDGGSENDSLTNTGSNATLNGGLGDDLIYAQGSRQLIQYDKGDGNDTVFGCDSTTTLSLTDYTMYNTLRSGSDLIVSIGSESITFKDTAEIAIDGGYRDIWNYVPNITLRGTSGSDTIQNAASGVTIAALGGNDTILNIGSDHVTIDAGAGNDTIGNYDPYVSINGGAGNDSILNVGVYSTVRGGTGNDTINGGVSTRKLYQYSRGDGNDLILSFDESDTLRIMNAALRYSTVIGGNNVIVSINDTVGGLITLNNTVNKKLNIVGGILENTVNNTLDNVSVIGTAGNDTVINTARNVTIQAGAGNDSIKASAFEELFLVASNHGENVIDGFDANDSLKCTAGSIGKFATVGNNVVVTLKGTSYTGHVTLKGAAAYGFKQSGSYLLVDSILAVPDGYSLTSNAQNNQRIVGSEGRDYIQNSGVNVTVQADGGNDIIESSEFGELIVFGANDGRDTVMFFGDNDSIAINSGSISGGSTVGNDYVVTVRGSSASGTITLKDVASKKFTINGSRSGLSIVPQPISIRNSKDTTLISGSSGADSIINTGEHVTIRAGEGNDTLEGSNYGELYLFGAVDGNNVITNFGLNDTIRLTFGSIESGSISGDDYVLNIKGANRSATVRLKNAGAYNFSQDATLLTVDSVDTITNNRNTTLIGGSNGADYILNPGYQNVSIQANGGNDTIEGGNFGEWYLFGAADGDNVITNFDKNDSLKMISGDSMTYSTVGADVIVTISGTSGAATVKLLDAAKLPLKKSGSNLIVDSINTLRNSTPSTLVSGSSGRDYIFNSGANVTIQAGGGDDTVEGANYAETFLFSPSDGNDTIMNFGAGNDTLRALGGSITTLKSGSDVLVSIKSGSSVNRITLKDYGGSLLKKSGSNILFHDGINAIVNTQPNRPIETTGGRDSVNNSGANVTLVGSAGNDTFSGSDYGELYRLASNHGNNVITNFGKGDSLQMTAGSTMTFAQSGSHVLVTLKGASYTGVETLRNLTVDKLKKIGNNLLVYSAVNTISNSRSNTLIAGSTEDDLIVNSGANVTIQAKTGNDTIEASSNKELFDFSSADGNNLILNFGKEDSLRMTAGKTITYKKSGADMIVTLKGTSHTGVETLKGAGDFNFVKSGTVLYVKSTEPTVNNRNTYKFNGTSDDDYLINYGCNVTIEPKAGNDTITGSDEYGEWINFSADNGSNVITNFGKNDSIRALSGTISSALVGNNAIVSIKSGSSISRVTLVGAKDYDFVRSSDRRTLTVKQDSTIRNDNDNTLVAGTDSAELIVNGGQLVTIQSGGGNDTIEPSDYYGEVFAFSSADGNNVITNFGVNDTLFMSAGSSLTYSTLGADVIVTLKGTSYTGTITLKDAAGMSFKKSRNGRYLTVDGVNYKLNRSNRANVVGTDGRDYIESTGNNVTLDGKGGDDTLVGSDSYGDLFLFSSDAGNDVIANFASNDTIQIVGGKIDAHYREGSDYVVNVRSNAFAGSLTLKDAGNLKFVEDGNYLTVDKLNYVVNRLDNTLAVGSDSRDFITNSGQNVTIQGNRGNDTIEGSSFGEVFAFSSADGNNVVTNFGANDTLKMIAGQTISFVTVGADVIVTLKGASHTGVETLLGAAGLPFKKSGINLYATSVTQRINTQSGIKFDGTSGADYMINSGSNVTLASGGGNDTIEGSSHAELFQFASNTGNNVVFGFGVNDTLQCTAGSIQGWSKSGSSTIVTLKGATYTGKVTLRNTSDYVFKKSGTYLTVDAVNNISNSDDKKLVSGSTGRDYIVNSGQNVTIQANGGNDTIEGSAFGELFDFSSADGNNLIKNFGANDTLRMTAGKTLSFATVGADVVVTLKGTSFTGIETLQGAAGLNFQKSGLKLYVGGVNQKLNTSSNVKVTGTSGADYIINTGNNVTVQSNGGADTITGSDVYGEVFAFSSADGRNVITNFGTNDTLVMTAGKTISYAADDSDYVITFKGASYTGTIRLLGAADVGTIRKSGSSVMLWSGSSSSELSTEVGDYWFERIEQNDQAADELQSILSIENNPIDFEIDSIDRFKRSELELVSSARSERLKK